MSGIVSCFFCFCMFYFSCFLKMFAKKLFYGLVRNSTRLFYSTSARLDPTKWRIEVALLIYRPPIVAPSMSEVEEQFSRVSELANQNSSYKCDFELQLEKDEKLFEKRRQLEKEGKDLSALDEEINVSAIQFKDDWFEESEKLTNQYKLELPQLTNDDDKNQKYFGRMRPRKLALIVKQRFPDAPSSDYVSPWILPQLQRTGNDSLRQTAEKCVAQLLPNFDQMSIGFQILGNAPISHLVNNYSNAMKRRLGFDGSVIFIFPVLIHQKSSNSNAMVDMTSDNVTDYQWCTTEELDDFKLRRKYKSAFDFALIE